MMLGLNPTEQEMVDIPNQIARLISRLLCSLFNTVYLSNNFQEWFNILPRFLSTVSREVQTERGGGRGVLQKCFQGGQKIVGNLKNSLNSFYN